MSQSHEQAHESGFHEGGFHEGERAVQRRAGVAARAAMLEGMLDPAYLSAGVVHFLAEQRLVALTARDGSGRLWTSPLVGQPGFVEVPDPRTLRLRAAFPAGSPLADPGPGQPVGVIAVDYRRRHRFRLNGTLVSTSPTELGIAVEEAFGNCPKYIPQRTLEVGDAVGAAEGRAAIEDAQLTDADRAVIRAAGTFILGTTHPTRGNDASHRGGPPGFVRVEGDTVWWPDYPGNNLFNSLGNVEVDPEAALLFLDFEHQRALQVSGTARLELVEPGSPGDDGRTGRRTVLTVEGVAHSPLPLDSELVGAFPRNPAVG